MNRNTVIIVVVVFAGLFIGYALSQSQEAPPVENVEPVNTSNVDPILFVHGYSRNAGDWNTFINKLVNDGYPRDLLYAYTHASSSSSDVGARELQANEIDGWVDSILNETGADKVDIIGHSQGGVTSRYYIKYLGGGEKVDVFITLASPHHGIASANVPAHIQPNDIFYLELNEGDETPCGLLPDIEGWRDYPVGGGGCNGTHEPGNVTYITMGSPIDKSVFPEETCKLEGSEYIKVSISHSQFTNNAQVYKHIKEALE